MDHAGAAGPVETQAGVFAEADQQVDDPLVGFGTAGVGAVHLIGADADADHGRVGGGGAVLLGPFAGDTFLKSAVQLRDPGAPLDMRAGMGGDRDPSFVSRP